ncbi:helix-turn-helix transcriptional regulator [Nocardia jejuensis]|uniref:helix-turn-helix transcriptional regulator n=1 Tax=Nocardia jejuensis TaxID=328049 RepID=UPI000832F986|nr:helix-turn-helix domain-containing protein [Nocardia jejuensis]
MTVVSSIGDAIHAARRRHRLTQEQLAELAGTSTRTVREIEHGSGSTSIATVAIVADVLGLTLGVVG